MRIKDTASGSLPEKIMKLIEISLKEKSNINCEVIIVVKPGEKSGSSLVLTIESPVNYEDYEKLTEL